MQAWLNAYDADESALLTLVLQRAGFAVRSLPDLERVFAGLGEKDVDLLLLVLRKGNPPHQLPGQIRQLRDQSEALILVIGELVDEDFQINLLESGVDLFVARPYSARWLIAQVRAMVRRSGVVSSFALPTLQVREISLDPAARMVTVLGCSPVRLTHLEFRLLYTLMMHPGQVFPAETLVEHVWGYNGQGERDLVRGLVRRLRAKIEPEPKEPIYIKTIPGIGYVLEGQPE
jgi:DNA-binding response OmpR family regulator